MNSQHFVGTLIYLGLVASICGGAFATAESFTGTRWLIGAPTEEADVAAATSIGVAAEEAGAERRIQAALAGTTRIGKSQKRKISWT